MSGSSGSDSRITRFKTPQIHARQGLISLVSPIASGIYMSSRDAPLANAFIEGEWVDELREVQNEFEVQKQKKEKEDIIERKGRSIENRKKKFGIE